MSEDKSRHLVVLLEDLLRTFQIGCFRIEIWRRAVTRQQVKAIQGSLQITEDHRRRHTEQHKEDAVDPDDNLEDVVDDSQSVHQWIVEENVIIEYAEDPQSLTHDRSYCCSGEK